MCKVGDVTLESGTDFVTYPVTSGDTLKHLEFPESDGDKILDINMNGMRQIINLEAIQKNVKYIKISIYQPHIRLPSYKFEREVADQVRISSL